MSAPIAQDMFFTHLENLKVHFSKTHIDILLIIEREKFYPGPGFEPGPLAFRANALTNWSNQDKHGRHGRGDGGTRPPNNFSKNSRVERKIANSVKKDEKYVFKGWNRDLKNTVSPALKEWVILLI